MEATGIRVNLGVRVMTALEYNRDAAKAATGCEFVDRVDQFIAAVQAKTDAYTAANFKNLTPDTIGMTNPWGKRYIRITRNSTSSGSVHCFIDRTNGDILKADGYTKPAKHARGNIFADDLGMSCMDPYGPKYLR